MYFVHPQISPIKYCSAVISLLAKSLNRVKLNKRLEEMFPGKQLIFTDMGRSAFKLIVENLNLRNSEILFPAYICDIFYAIFKQYDIKPIFLDVDLDTFHIKNEEIVKKITPETKAIFICHTYGLPFDVDALRSDLLHNFGGGQTSQNFVIIEDCAHSFFAKKNGIYAGNFGNNSFFSLYKQFPSLRGGMLVCPNAWKVNLPKTSFNFRDFISFLNYLSPFSLFFKKFGSEIAPKILRKEKLPEPAGLTSASLNLFSDFFEDTERSLENRKQSALLLQEELKKMDFEIQKPENNVFCYLSALVPKGLTEKRDQVVQKLKKCGIFCTRIWHAPIILNKEAQKEYGFNLAEFPNTIEAAKRIINFPLQNYYAEKDIKKIAEAVKKVLSNL